MFIKTAATFAICLTKFTFITCVNFAAITNIQKRISSTRIGAQGAMYFYTFEIFELRQ